MLDLHVLIPGDGASAAASDAAGPAAEPTQHLDAEVVCSHLRRLGYQVALADAALLPEGPGGLFERLRTPARYVLWFLPTVRHLRVLEKLLEKPLGSGEDLGRRTMLAGGQAATHFATPMLERMPRIAAVVRGELERPLEMLLANRDHLPASSPGLSTRRADAAIHSPSPPAPLSAEELPPAAMDLFHESRRQRAQKILIGRGCDSLCRYCGLGPFFRTAPAGAGRWRMRPPAQIADEIEHLVRRFGVDRFSFEAAVFFGYDERGTAAVEALGQEILRRGLQIRFKLVTHPGHLLRNAHLLPLLRQAGLELVYLGLDSGSDDSLRRYDVAFRRRHGLEALRLLHELRIPLTPLFIFYEPYMEMQDIEAQLFFLRRAHDFFGHCKPPYAYYLDRYLLSSVLEIKAFMPMAEELRRDGLVVEGGEAPWTPIKARFRDPAVSAFYRVDRQIRRRLLIPLRPLLWNPRVAAVEPPLELLPLDLLDAASQRLGDGGSEDEAAAEAGVLARDALAGRVEELAEVAELGEQHRQRVLHALD